MIQLLVNTKALWQFAKDCLDPERFGHQATAEIRDAAREALGYPKAETLGSAYDEVQQAEFNERDR